MMTEQEILQTIHRLSLKMLGELDKVCTKYGIDYYVAYGTLLGAVRHKGFIPWDNDIDLFITRENYARLRPHLDELPKIYTLIDPAMYGDRKYNDCVPRLNTSEMYLKMPGDICSFYNDMNNRLHLDFFFLDKTYDDWRGKLQRFELAGWYGLMNAYRHKSYFEHYSAGRKALNRVLCVIGRCIPLNWMRKRVERVATRYNGRADAKVCFNSNDTYESLARLLPVDAFGKPGRLPFANLQVPVPSDPDRLLRVTYGDYWELPPESERIPHWGADFVDAESFVFAASAREAPN